MAKCVAITSFLLCHTSGTTTCAPMFATGVSLRIRAIWLGAFPANCFHTVPIPPPTPQPPANRKLGRGVSLAGPLHSRGEGFRGAPLPLSLGTNPYTHVLKLTGSGHRTDLRRHAPWVSSLVSTADYFANTDSASRSPLCDLAGWELELELRSWGFSSPIASPANL